MFNFSVLPRISFRFFWICFLMLLPVSAYSQLTQEIDKALKESCLDKRQTSVSVVALPSGKDIYAKNIHEPLLPASVMKLVTTAAALYYLGPEYRFKTEFLYSGARKGSVIRGDLIIRGGGDPRLSTENLWYIATQIKQSGIKEITGNLVIDTHFFDESDRAPEWEEKRSQRAYDAKLSALALNFNSIAIHLQPSSQKRPNTWLDPALPYMSLRNTAKTTKRGRTTVGASRSENVPGKVEIRVGGKLPISAKEKVIYINVDKPTRYAAETFRTLLQGAGVKINGEIKIISTPIIANPLREHFSPPLSLILKELNTYSNNLTAEQIVKTIAAERFGTPGSHAEGLRLIEDFLRISGVNTEGVQIKDGSGLSRKNRMTTRAITALLRTTASRFDIGPDFIAALPTLGKNGLHSQRLKNSPARKKTRGKTGTLKGVSTLAGYVASKNGRIFAYALFLNNNRCGHWNADRIEDRIVTAIYNYGEGAFKN
jgi:D-alanyl-D-alanine carboxypeptidase/D-alanyl-D-alanine-endopeptidase (penicillin-binding protein 4)